MWGGGIGLSNLPTSMQDLSLFVHNTNVVSGLDIESALFEEKNATFELMMKEYKLTACCLQ